MSELEKNGPKPAVRLIEIAVFCAAFYIACRLFAVETSEDLFRQMAIYSSIVMLSIILCQEWLGTYPAFSEIARYVLADAIGIIAGTCAVLMLQSVVFISVEYSAAVILASVVSFFVLGTISPLVRSPRSRRKTGACAKKTVARF